MAIDYSALELGNDVGRLLTRYVAVHDACFSFSLRRVISIPGIFRAVDYRQMCLNLDQVHAQLQATKRAIEAALAEEQSTPEWTRFLEGLSEYSGTITTTVGRLANICTHLSNQAEGAVYKAADYKRDVADYRASVDRYVAQGAQLNRSLQEAMRGH